MEEDLDDNGEQDEEEEEESSHRSISGEGDGSLGTVSLHTRIHSLFRLPPFLFSFSIISLLYIQVQQLTVECVMQLFNWRDVVCSMLSSVEHVKRLLPFDLLLLERSE